MYHPLRVHIESTRAAQSPADRSGGAALPRVLRRRIAIRPQLLDGRRHPQAHQRLADRDRHRGAPGPDGHPGSGQHARQRPDAVPAPVAQQPRKRNSTRAPAESWHDLDRLNGIGRHLGRLLAPEKLQQDRNALVCGLACIQRERSRNAPETIRTRSPGWSPRGSGSSTSPSRSRERSSAITSSGTCPGPSPAMISDSTPGHQRAACQCRAISTKQYGGCTSTRRPRTWRGVAERHYRPRSSLASRFTAGAAGFLHLSQSGERPDR
jgi:hypothetical protein